MINLASLREARRNVRNARTEGLVQYLAGWEHNTIELAAHEIEKLRDGLSYAANIMDFMSDHHGGVCTDCEAMHKEWVEKYGELLPKANTSSGGSER